MPERLDPVGPARRVRLEHRFDRRSDSYPRRVGLLLRSDSHDLPADGRRRKDDVGLFCFSGPTCQPTPQFPYLFPNTTSLGINQLCDTPDPQNGVVYGCPGPNIVDPNFKNPRISNLTGSIEHTFARSWTATLTFAWANSQHLRTGGYGSEEAWYRNFTSDGTDQFGRAILTGVLDDTLASSTNITASYAHGNYVSGVFNLTKRFSNNFQMFTNYIWSQNKDNGASERDTDTYFGQQDPFNINLDYGRNGLDIKHQFKAGWRVRIADGLHRQRHLDRALAVCHSRSTGR